MALIEIRNLSFTYPDCAEPALQEINLTVPSGSFTVLCGASGSGKTTLLRLCKPPVAPHGSCTGEILLDGQNVLSLDAKAQASRIGFVSQSPEEQIVTDKVWHELAFGMESLGYDTMTIRRRTAEMASFFGIEDWFDSDTDALSGGQKQILNLASVMALQPEVLILDEPTAQLDPIAATEFLSMLSRLNRELGTTVLLSEHRLEDALPLADQAAVLDCGRLLCRGTPASIGLTMRDHGMFAAMPAAMRVWSAVAAEPPCPVTVREGRRWLADFAAHKPLKELPRMAEKAYTGEPRVLVREAWFRYEKDTPDVLRGVSLAAYPGEVLAIVGGNGAGKSTLLKLLDGERKPYRGAVETEGKTVLMPQQPRTLFAHKTLRESLMETAQDIDDAVHLCRLERLLERHPYDLSGGEMQRAALAKVLLMQPDTLLLDEPTKGVDAAFKPVLAEILRSLAAQGKTVILVSHDVEFCALCADRCALLFDGSIASEGTPRAFFAGNGFYTTAASRMARELLPDAVTAEDLIYACGGELPQAQAYAPEEIPPAPVKETAKLPLWRKLLAAIFGASAIGILIWFLRTSSLNELLSGDLSRTLTSAELLRYGAFFASVLLCAVMLRQKRSGSIRITRRKTPLRTVLACVSVLVLVPLTIWLGEAVLGGRKYYFISLLVLLEILLPFFISFEGRKPKARELVLIASLCALGVASRAAFFMLPQFKPVLALTILAGVALGAETGFLVGSVTMLTSNLLFSQGPWTPWQMAAMGIVGFLAGLIFRRGASRLLLAVFGAIAAIAVYGLIMNTASAVIWAHTVTPEILLTYYVTGFPVDCVHAAATALFLWLLADPMLEKLERIKKKYGLQTGGFSE